MTREKALVLLVEDEEVHVELIRRAFAPSADSLSLITASCVRDAQRKIRESVPDLVIADLILPDGKGIELLPEDTEQAQFPVVVMTSHGDERVAVEAMKAGALHYVVKSAMTLTDLPQVRPAPGRRAGVARMESRRRAQAGGAGPAGQ